MGYIDGLNFIVLIYKRIEHGKLRHKPSPGAILIHARLTYEAMEMCHLYNGYTDRWVILTQGLHLKLWRFVTFVMDILIDGLYLYKVYI